MAFNASPGRTNSQHADQICEFVKSREHKVISILETHVYADHVTAPPYLRKQLGGPIAIGDQNTAVQETFGALFIEPQEFARDGPQFNRLLIDVHAAARQHEHRRDAYTWTHPGLGHLCRRGRGVCWRYRIHARCRHRSV